MAAVQQARREMTRRRRSVTEACMPSSAQAPAAAHTAAAPSDCEPLTGSPLLARRRLCGGRGRACSGTASLSWLLVAAAVAAICATAVVVVQTAVRDVAVDAGSYSARFRAAVIAADTVTRHWRAHVPADRFEADQLNRRYAERCARIGITYADTEALPHWKPGVLAAGGGWFEVHKLPVCSLQDIRGERERFRPFNTQPQQP